MTFRNGILVLKQSLLTGLAWYGHSCGWTRFCVGLYDCQTVRVRSSRIWKMLILNITCFLDEHNHHKKTLYSHANFTFGMSQDTQTHTQYNVLYSTEHIQTEVSIDYCSHTYTVECLVFNWTHTDRGIHRLLFTHTR